MSPSTLGIVARTPPDTGPTPVHFWSLSDSASALPWADTGSSANNFAAGSVPSNTQTGPDGSTSVRSWQGSSSHYVETTGTQAQPTGDFTLEVWAKPTAASLMHILSHNVSTARNFQLLTAGGGGFPTLNLFDTSGSLYAGDSNAAALSTSAWTHLAVSFSDSLVQFKWYINGSLARTFSATPSGGTRRFTAGVWRLALYPDGTNGPFNGGLAKVAYYAEVLTAARILAHKQETVP